MPDRYCTCGHASSLHTRVGRIIDPCVVDGCECNDLLYRESRTIQLSGASGSDDD